MGEGADGRFTYTFGRHSVGTVENGKVYYLGGLVVAQAVNIDYHSSDQEAWSD